MQWADHSVWRWERAFEMWKRHYNTIFGRGIRGLTKKMDALTPTPLSSHAYTFRLRSQIPLFNVGRLFAWSMRLREI
jgi:hypothetical protein